VFQWKREVRSIRVRGVVGKDGGLACVEVEFDVCVFFAFGAVVVWAAFDSVKC
jgi:hypothetical protein